MNLMETVPILIAGILPAAVADTLAHMPPLGQGIVNHI